MKTVTFLQVPFTGLGKINRGNAWLKNRIKIFKTFVIPSLQAQTSKDFILHCCWRPEEKGNKYVKELQVYLDSIKEFKTIHTFNGILFYDDKYEDSVARERLTTNLHATIGEMFDYFGDAEWVLAVLQPSDDCYEKHVIETLQWMFANEKWQAIGFSKGYICNYLTKEIANYDPKTNPPFATIKFPKEVFANALKHIEYVSMKRSNGKYKVGTPLPSHEYYADVFLDKYNVIDERGFIVGVHKQNISTSWQIPYKGEIASREVLKDFGIVDVPPIKLRIPLRKRLFFSLPYKVQRKLRYWFTEKFRK